MDELEDYVWAGIHASIVGLHLIEISHAKEMITVGLLIAVAYSLESSVELKRVVRHWRKGKGNDNR